MFDLSVSCCASVFSFQAIGVFLGSFVEKILTEAKQPNECLLTKQDLMRASKVFKNILLKCRHWVSILNIFLGFKLEFCWFIPEESIFPHQGAVEGCCIGFTKFCASLLSSVDPELNYIPAQMLKQVSDAYPKG